MANASEESRLSFALRGIAWLVPYVLAWLVLLVGEHAAPSPGSVGQSNPIAWLLHADLDAIVYLALLLAAPLVWWLGDVRSGGRLARRFVDFFNRAGSFR
jgi:hypothetical protein